MARDAEGNVIFDEQEQQEVDRIVKDRLERAKKPEDYTDLTEISQLMEVFGFSGTPSEKKAAIKEYIDRTNQPINEVVDEIAETGEIPDDAILKALAKKFGTTPDKIEKSIKKSIELDDKEAQKQQADAEWAKQVTEFEEKHPDINIEALNEDKRFLKFANKRIGTITELYEEYLEFLDDTAQEVASKLKKSAERTTGGGTQSNTSTGLSKSEQEQLDDWNRRNPHMKMSAKEFKERQNR